MQVRTFMVPPNFFNGTPEAENAMQQLEEKGVHFPTGASVVSNPGQGTLTVINSADQMKLIEAALTPPSTSTTSTTGSTKASNSAKLQSILISIDLQNVDIATLVGYLNAKSKELDPDKIGVNFILQKNPSGIVRKVSIRACFQNKSRSRREVFFPLARNRVRNIAVVT